MKETLAFPIRINKYLAHKGYSSRRGADELIEKKLVKINGAPAKLGDMVTEGDIVEVNEKATGPLLYAIWHKTKGEMKDILVMQKTTLYAVDQLEKDVSGLVIFTNDRRIASRLNDTRYPFKREYIVHTKEALRANTREKLLSGIQIEGEKEPIRAEDAECVDERTLSLTLSGNRQHIVKRILVALFNEAVSIERARIGELTVKSVPAGKAVLLSSDQIQSMLATLGLEARSK